jgi:7-alpha-hydroxysteroid dehydrogenase
VKLDVMNEAERCTAVEQAVKQFGKLTILVNNAGGGGPKPFDMPMSDFERAFQLNLFSVFRMSQLCAPHMKAAGGGAIINISSMAGQNKNKRMCSYGASKAAVDHLTRNMAFDLGPDKIRVNAIAPGAIRTAALATVLTPDVEAAMLKHTPLGRLGEGSDIAAAAVYIGVTGVILGQRPSAHGKWRRGSGTRLGEVGSMRGKATMCYCVYVSRGRRYGGTELHGASRC